MSTLVNSDQRVEELSHQETSLRSPAPTLRSVPLLLVIKIFVPLQNSEIALTTARFNVNPSILAKGEPSEAQSGRKRHQVAGRTRDLPDLYISEARAHVHEFQPICITQAVRAES